MPKVIDGVLYKELLCKNDSCMHHFGYHRIKRGIIIIVCRNCGHFNKWQFHYSKLEENVDMLIESKDMKKGGED